MAESNTKLKPEIRVFAGPNGSGKSTITLPEYILPPYINADDIKRELGCTDLDAAKIATSKREAAVQNRQSFTFETVLSTDRNIKLLETAKQNSYFIRCAFVLTINPELNVERVKSRVANGGHDVPAEKVILRYHRSIAFIPRLIRICDRLNIYDNSTSEPQRIFKLRSSVCEVFPTDIWPADKIMRLVIDGKVT